MMGGLKSLELGFRRVLLKTLKTLSRPRQELPRGIDFSQCKFLFIRQDRIGDVLVSTPLFGALKRHYPAATIDVLLSENNSFVLDNDPLIRKRWVYDKKLVSSLSTLSSIRKERYDFVVDLMDNPSATSTVIMLLARGRWNVGLEKENAYAYDIVVPLLSRRETHIVDRLGQLLIPLGIRPESEDLRVRYLTSEESERFVSRFLNESNGAGRLIGINISAGSDARFWGIAKYQKLLRLLLEQYPSYTVVLLHKPADRGRAVEIIGSSRRVFKAPDELAFDQFAAFIKNLSVLITPDTSAVHLAAAFQVPSVILYVQSNKDLMIWEPYKTACESIVTDVDDLSSISVTDVVHAFERLQKNMLLTSSRRSSDVVRGA